MNTLWLVEVQTVISPKLWNDPAMETTV